MVLSHTALSEINGTFTGSLNHVEGSLVRALNNSPVNVAVRPSEDAAVIDITLPVLERESIR